MTNTQYFDVVMPPSLSNILIHSISSTKNREPLLCEKELRRRTQAYLAEVLKSLQCPALIVGAMNDTYGIEDKAPPTLEGARRVE